MGKDSGNSMQQHGDFTNSSWGSKVFYTWNAWFEGTETYEPLLSKHKEWIIYIYDFFFKKNVDKYV
jgi:hypothetical protein